MKNGFLKRIVYVICLFSALLLFRQAGIYFVEQSLEEWEASLQYSIEDIYAPWNPVITEMFGNSWEDMRITDVLVSKSHARHDSMIALIAVPEARLQSGTAERAVFAVAGGGVRRIVCVCVTEALIQRVGLLITCGDVIQGIPFFAGGIFEIIHCTGDGDSDEADAKQCKEDGRPHGNCRACPDNAEKGDENSHHNARHGRTASGLDAFHGVNPFLN